jgi:hypothetical protein
LIYLNHLILQTPPSEEIPVPIPFGNSCATIYYLLFRGILFDVNTGNDSFKPVLHTYNLETNNGIYTKNK